MMMEKRRIGYEIGKLWAEITKATEIGPDQTVKASLDPQYVAQTAKKLGFTGAIADWPKKYDQVQAADFWLGYYHRRRELSDVYGIAEIAESIGARPQTVAQWHRRGKLPPPDQQLAMGPIWFGDTIEPWIEQRRSESE